MGSGKLHIVYDFQQGDGGKGAVADELVQDPRSIAAVRPHGGNNAGHTFWKGDQKYALHLIPGSILTEEKKALIGQNVVVSPEVLFKEIYELSDKLGRDVSKDIVLDEKAHIICPWHIELDRLHDELQGKMSAGSTKRGIAPVYGAKAERFGIRVADLLAGSGQLENAINQYVNRLSGIEAVRILEEFGENGSIGAEDKVLEFLIGMRDRKRDFRAWTDDVRRKFEPYESIVGDVRETVDEFLEDGYDVIVEMAQSGMLSINAAYYPFGTSSDASPTGAWGGIGLRPREEIIGNVLGVGKAYVTRVGNGPFVTEFNGEVAHQIRERGYEYGTTTGRPRKVGWFDSVMAKTCDPEHLVITKVDVLGGLEKIKIATTYESGIDKVPATDYDKCVPVYKELSGWSDMSTDEYRKHLEDGIDNISNENLYAFMKTIEDSTERHIKGVRFGKQSGDWVYYL